MDLGVALTNADDWKGAEVEFREAVRLDPQHAGARLRLGICLVLNGKIDEGIARAVYPGALAEPA